MAVVGLTDAGVGGRLATFLQDYAARPWNPGEVDCCLYLADWAMACGHDDPAASLRGTYSGEAEMRAVVERAGGLVPLVLGCASSIGLVPVVNEPLAAGDFAVIGSAKRADRQWGAIYDGASFRVVTSDNGIARMAAKILMRWKMTIK